MLLPSLLLAVATALPAAPAEIAPTFVEILRADDAVTAHERLGIPGATMREWRSLVEISDKLECISVPSYTSAVTVDGETATVVVTANATGYTIGPPHRLVQLPREWIIDAVRDGDGWRFRSIRTRERIAAGEIVAADAARRRALFDEHVRSLDYPLLVWNIADLSRANREDVLRFLIDLTRELEDRRMETLALFAMASMKRQAEAPDMQQAAEETLAAGRASGDPQALVTGLFIAGGAAGDAGDPDEQLALLREAAALVDEVEDPRLALNALHNASMVELQRGRFVEAMQLAQRNLDVSRRIGWLDGQMYASTVLASVHGELRNMDTFFHITEQLIALTRRLRNRRVEAMALANKASELMAADPAAAVVAIEQSIELEKGFVEASEIPTGFMMLGNALAAAGRWDEAERALEKARTPPGERVYPQREVMVLAALSDLKRRRGDAEGALKLAREAAAVGATFDTVAGDNYGFSPWASKGAEARALRELGRRDEAAAAFRDAIAVIESFRQSLGAPETASYAFMEGKTEVYRELAELLAGSGRAAEALELTSAVKARTLLEAVQRGHVDPFAGITDEERATYERLDANIEKLNVDLLAAPDAEQARLKQRLADARTELETFEVALFGRHKPLRVTAAERPPADLTSLATGGTAIVEYLIGESSTLAFVLAPGRPVATETIAAGRDELQSQVARYLKKIERRDLTHGTDAFALYRLLVEPLEPHLGGAKVLCIVPDGVLWRVPFQALRSPEGRYLLEKRAFFYAPSLGALQLARSRGRAAAPRSIVAVGNPAVAARTRAAVRAILRDAPLGDLPDAADEARAVGRMYARPNVLIGAEAREERVKDAAPSSDVLHFATHALVNDSQPLYSSIVLAGGDAAEDGLLEAREILGSDLRADLVVLSACSTARGEISPGEGLVGLTWSFLIAGASSTVAAQWPVVSKSTAELMVAFHRQLTSSPAMGKAEALRQAQLGILRKRGYEHPFYWSPFVLVGAN